MPLHLRVPHGASFEVKVGDQVMRVSVNREMGNTVHMSFDGPKDFVITNHQNIEPKRNVIIKIRRPDEPHREA